jgi:carbamoyl-phosphate synthase large subunit
VLGTPVAVIRATEDRQLFVDRLCEIGVKTARSRACTTPHEAVAAAREIGLPVILRGAFSLGGKGSAIVRDERDIEAAVRRMLAGVPQVLVEECLSGWKEIEYEVVRDSDDNCITVCNMENVDPMGIHTGDSIVVAPSQTLNDHEYQFLREIAIRNSAPWNRGECNIQYALEPATGDYRVIEVNARLALVGARLEGDRPPASAYVAAKIGLGYTPPQIRTASRRPPRPSSSRLWTTSSARFLAGTSTNFRAWT